MRNLTFAGGMIAALLGSPLAYGQMGPANVIVAPVQKEAIELTRPLVASVEAVTYTTLAAEQEGLVKERSFDEGQKVQKGTVLVRVDTDLLKIQLDAAEASRRALEGELAKSKAEAENAARELSRMKELYETQVAPEKEYRDAVTANEIALASVTVRTAELAEQKAEVDRLDLMIEKAQVKSPIDGIIARRHVEVGQWIKQGDPVAEVVQLDPLWVRVAVPEEVIQRVQPGDEARVTVDALGGKVFAGKVDQVLPVADMSSRTVWVKILVPNPEDHIRPGFFARAVLTSTSDAASLTVPKDALVMQGDKAQIAVVRDGKAVVIPVERGSAQGDRQVVISPDLKEGDQVIVRGNEGLRGGEDVVVQNAAPADVPPASQPAAAG